MRAALRNRTWTFVSRTSARTLSLRAAAACLGAVAACSACSSARTPAAFASSPEASSASLHTAPTVSSAPSAARPAGSRPGVDPASAPPPPPSPPPPPGEVSRTEAAVRAGTMEDVFLMTGELRAVRSRDLVVPRTDTWRVQITGLAEDGAEVREADRAIEFDNTAVIQSIEEKRLTHIQSEITLESRGAQLTADGEEKRFACERAKTEAEKARLQASVPQDLLPLRDWQEKQTALRAADASLAKARLELESFEVASKAGLENLRIARDKAAREIEAAQRTLDALVLKAPKAGIFVISENWNEDRKYEIGDTVWPGQTIASIPDLTLMEAIPYLADVDEGKIQPGMSARCILDTYPERVFKGKVEEVGAVADKKGFRVRVSLEGADPGLMRPGMSVRVEVVRKHWERALSVPKHAVRRRESKTYVAKAGAADPVEVRLGACTPIECVVESGLAEGDHVLLR